MTKTQHRDTVDCLICELTDAYDQIGLVHVSHKCGMSPGDREEVKESALASIERALQLVSDLKAAQS